MQLAGSQFTDTTAFVGNDLSTLPDFPAEIRAPAGSLSGVSGFQLHFSSSDIQTPGDSPDVLVAMNPAALKVNLKDLKKNATLIINTNSFDAKNLRLAQFDTNPIDDGSLSNFNVIPVPLTQVTMAALEDLPLSLKEKEKCKNIFALGLMYWMFNRPIEITLKWLEQKFKKENRTYWKQINAYYLRDIITAIQRRYLQPGMMLSRLCSRKEFIGIFPGTRQLLLDL